MALAPPTPAAALVGAGGKGRPLRKHKKTPSEQAVHKGPKQDKLADSDWFTVLWFYPPPPALSKQYLWSALSAHRSSNRWGRWGGERPGGFRGRYTAHRTVAYRKHACLPRHGSWVRNPADRSLGVHHSGRHGGWFYFRLGGTCQLNPVPAEGREGDLTYPEELWRRLRRRIRRRAVALHWTDGTMFAAAPPRDTC